MLQFGNEGDGDVQLNNYPMGIAARSVLYNHYQDFCKRNAMEPVGAASFGKVYIVYIRTKCMLQTGSRH